MEESIKIIKANSEKEVADAQEVRRKVFIEEQKISPELDLDGEDKNSDHFVAYSGNTPIGTTRIRYLDNGVAKIERTSIVLSFRGKNVGKKLMEESLSYIKTKGIKEVMLYAQEHARGFYEKLGFKQEGDVFEEVGIPHVKMVLILN